MQGAGRGGGSKGVCETELLDGKVWNANRGLAARPLWQEGAVTGGRSSLGGGYAASDCRSCGTTPLCS
jgi:hypothetical protein